MKMKKHKRFAQFLAIFLMFSMASIDPMQVLSHSGITFAASEKKNDNSESEALSVSGSAAGTEPVQGDSSTYPEGTKFVKQVRLIRGFKDVWDAKMNYPGWQVLEQDLNEGTKGGAVWLAYSTTTNPDEAVRDLKIMPMNGGYKKINYTTLVEQSMFDLSEHVDEIMVAAAEASENEADGMKGARYAKDFLNLFTMNYDGSSGDNFGDYLLKGGYKKEDIKNLYMRTSPMMINTILTQLALAVVDRDGEKWADKVAGQVDIMAGADKEQLAEMDRLYQDTARRMAASVQDFSKKVRTAQAKISAAGGVYETEDGIRIDAEGNMEVSDSAAETAEKTGEDKLFTDTAKTIRTDGFEEEDLDGIVSTMSMYHSLNQYSFDASTGLGQFFVDVGNAQIKSVSSYRMLYPVIMALTPGETAVLRYQGLSLLAGYLNTTDKTYAFLDQRMSYLQEKMREERVKGVPIWGAVDQSLFDEEVVYTDAKTRANVAKENFDAVTKTSAFRQFCMDFQTMSSLISAGIGLVGSIAGLVLGNVGLFFMIKAGAELLVFGIAAGAGCAAAGGFVAMICGILGVVGWIVLAATIIISLGFKIYDALVEKDEFDYDAEKDIPHIIIDTTDAVEGWEYDLRYDMVFDYVKNIKYGDLNNGEGKRWIALYSSTSEHAGDPICSTDMDDLLVTTTGDSGSPGDDYVPVSKFGAERGYNLNSYAKKDEVGGIYLWMRTGIPGMDRSGNTAKKNPSGGDLIGDLRFFSGASETEAKSQAEMEGYELLEANVAPLGGEKRDYLYIGYKRTKNKASAIRDIRVNLGKLPGIDEKSHVGEISYGDIKYSAYQDTTAVPFGISICFSKEERAGSLIHADNLRFFNTKKVEAGYEPVNLMSGGPAFNWHDAGLLEQQYDLYAMKHSSVAIEPESKSDGEYDKLRSQEKKRELYLYFKPEEVYTSGTEYISGICALAGYDGGDSAGDGRHLLREYADELGVKILGESLAADITQDDYTSEHDLITDYAIYLCAYTTYNPHRAITGLRYYRTDEVVSELPKNIRDESYGYVGIQSYMQPTEVRLSLFSDNYYLYRFYGGTGAYLDRYLGMPAMMLHNLFDFGRSTHSKSSFGQAACSLELTTILTKVKEIPYDELKKIDDYDLKEELRDRYHSAPYLYKDLYERYLNAKEGDMVPMQVGQDSRNIYVRGPVKDASPMTLDDIRMSTSATVPQGFNPVTEFLNEYDTKPANLAYDSGVRNPTKVYLYVRGEKKPDRPRYVKDLYMCGAETPADLKVEERTEYIAYMPENVRQALIQCGAKEILPENITDNPAVPSDKKATQWFGYIGCSRTNDDNEALRGVYKVTGVDENASGTRKILGAAGYKVAGGTAMSVNGRFCLCTSTNSGDGAPVMEIRTGADPLSQNVETVTELTNSEADKKDASPVVKTNDVKYIYLDRGEDGNTSFYSKFIIGVGANRREALADAAARGATSCVGFDLNYKAGGKYVLLGFKRTNDPESAIRDIYLTVGKEAQKMVDVDGYAYTCVGPVSLNAGTGGLSVYMYVTNGVKYVEATPDETEEYEDEEDEEDEDDNPFSRMSREEESKTKLEYMDLSPINQIVAMPRDFLPTPGKMGYVWEHLLTDEGSLCNVNEGAFSINEEDMSLADARLYLFARRRDNTVKPGARITEVDGRIMMGVGTIQYTSKGKLGSSSNTQSGNANRVDGPADGDWGGAISAPDPEYLPPKETEKPAIYRRPYLP
ncbi:MAG: hypothetical protein VZQ83_07530 [Eubacterium sp.]|nr:hypothetical protein [Eubacterium sp.]